MWMPRALALILALTLLFSAVGLIAHDHGLGLERGSYECVIDHHEDHDALDQSGLKPRGRAGMRQSGKLHRHQCVGCHFSSHRPLLNSYRDIETEIAVQGERIFRPSGAPRVLTAHPAYSLRGPPAV